MRLRMLELGLLIVVMAPSSALLADDAAIAQRLSESLKSAQNAGDLEGFRLNVNVEDGTVWVKGKVANEAQRVLALDRARRIAGVRLVVNDIQVAAPEGAMTNPATANRDTHGGQIAKMNSVMPIPTEPAPQPVPSPRPANSSRVQPAYPVPVAARPIQHTEGLPVDTGYAMGGYPNSGYPASNYVQTPPVPEYGGYGGSYTGGVNYEQPQMPDYAWPSYAANQNYAAVSYPQQYSPTAWPYIGPFYPYPQVPLGWRKVTLEWDDGWWMLDFNSK